MPNNTRTKSDGGWVDGYAPTPAEWGDLDKKTNESWNGDRGGAYAPADAVAIGGSGLQVTGPVRLTGGALLTGPASAFVIPDGTWPELSLSHSGLNRKIVQPIHAFNSPKPHLWTRNHLYAGVGSIALAARYNYSRAIEIPELYVPLRVIDGSQILTVEFHYRVALPRRVAPLSMPKFRVVRKSIEGAIEPLKLTADGTGFASPELAQTPDEWYAGGQAQKFVYTCDQHQTIDLENYDYIVHIVEEQGVLTPDDPFDGICFVERKQDVDMRDSLVDHDADGMGGGLIGPGLESEGWTLETLDRIIGDTASFPLGLHTYRMSDGVPIESFSDESGEGRQRRRILVANYSNTDADPVHLNGIWGNPIVGATDYSLYWQRAKDLDAIDDFSPNWFVVVKRGWTYGGAVFQCQYPSSDKSVELWMNDQYANSFAGIDEDGNQQFLPLNPNPINPKLAAKISITPAQPRGNIYHSVVPTFEVTDLRFQ